MSHDFYIKAQALHEEFQKRELHYLDTERKVNNSLMWRKDQNVPLQEYLKKIKQREKQTGEIYKNIIKQMDELDKQSDMLSMKLEKMGILQTSLATSSNLNWFSKLDLNAGSNVSSNLQTQDIYSVPVAPDAFLPLNSKSISTQTENSLYCEKCISTLKAYNPSSHLLEHFQSSSTTNAIFDGINRPLELLDSQDNSKSLLNENLSASQSVESIDKALLKPEIQTNVTKSSNIEQANVELLKNPSSDSLLNGRNVNHSFDSQMKGNQTIQHHAVENVEKLTASRTVGNENSKEFKTVDAESTKDTSVSKSDVESVNNEFDFLESDTDKVRFLSETQTDLKNSKSSTSHTKSVSGERPSSENHFVENKLSSDSKNQKKSSLPLKSSKSNAGDDKSETSESASAFHSPNISVTSDSESINEKGSPLTTSAAYQALLGNNVFPKKVPKNVSESESEDEVESALASAVQRSHTKSKLPLKPKKDAEGVQPAKAKPPDKPVKTLSGNKPQSKLSKNTRKVLGLDTSSGSEIEMAVKPPAGQKIDEDSDEFGFYD